MGHGSALKTLLLNIQFYVLVKTIDWYLNLSHEFLLPTTSWRKLCRLRVVRVLAAASQSLVKMILDGSHLHSLSGGGPVLGAAATAGPQVQLLPNSLFLLPAFWWHFSPSPKQCKHKKLLSVPPNLTTLHILVHFPAPAPCPECGWMSPCTVMTTIRGDVNASPHLDAAHSTNYDADPCALV